MSKSAPDPPQLPSVGEGYKEAIEVMLSRGPELRQLEFLDSLSKIDTLRRLAPASANVALGFEERFGPAFRAQATEAQRQQRAGDLFNVANLTPGLRLTEALADPRTANIRDILGRQVQSELQSGASLDPGLRREAEQAVRRGQTARGITRGAAPVREEALFVGQLADQMRRQRQQAAQNFMQVSQATQINPFAFAQGGGAVQPQANFPQSTAGGGIQNLFNQQQATAGQQAQLNYNAAQAGQGGGLGGALTGGITGFALTGNPLGAAAGALAGIL